jgi:DNA-binding transcriptional LysR family regulator
LNIPNYHAPMSAPFDLAQLRTLVAVAECGGVSRAAEFLHLSQPTVSQHLRLLERRMGEPLTERVGRGIALSPAGERLLLEARRILTVHDEAMSRLASSSGHAPAADSTETTADPDQLE